jgi:hypothetical protein
MLHWDGLHVGEPAVPLPSKLIDEPDNTAVIGDLDAFMAYVESGQAWQDWRTLQEAARKELDSFLRTRNYYWRHIVYQDSAPTDDSEVL